MTWWDDAACKGMNPLLFHPKVDHKTSRERGRQLYDGAKAVCATCPVVTPCLEVALHEERSSWRHGVRGGMTPEERAQYARKAESA